MSTPDGGPTLDAKLQEVVTEDFRGLVEKILCCRDLLHNVLNMYSGVKYTFTCLQPTMKPKILSFLL